MKTPEKIYLDLEDYHEFKYNIEYVNQEKQRDSDICYIREDVHEFQKEIPMMNGYAKALDDIEAGNDQLKHRFFTKEQVIELMKEAYEDGVSEGVNFYPEGSSIPSKKVMSYNEWLINLKPFDPK